jgi:glycosyltransferase involved in cell wall biosynthesis
MNYLLINHVPFGRSSTPNRFVVGDMWLEDLRAQTKAWSSYGRLGVAVPCTEELPVEASGSFNLVEVDPIEEGFELFPLPYYQSWKGFVQVFQRLRSQLEHACRWASIAQADYGGHPIALGQVAWSIAAKQNTQRIWLFDGADPFPRLQQYVGEESNPAKRIFKASIVKQFERFCRQAISEADLVFTHNAAVAHRFQDIWSDRCHSFNRSFVKQSFLIDEHQAEARKQRLLDRSQPLRIVTAGRQIAIKATDHVIRAVAIARQQGLNVELDVIGDGVALPSYIELANELGIADHVQFHGSIPYGQPLFDLLQQAHVLAITNLTAEISRNVLLGMALGLPLLIYRNPGTDAMIEQHDAGILVPTGDIGALSTALVDVATHRAQLAHLMKNGLRLAQAQTLEATHKQRAMLAADCVNQISTPNFPPTLVSL